MWYQKEALVYKFTAMVTFALILHIFDITKLIFILRYQDFDFAIPKQMVCNMTK